MRRAALTRDFAGARAKIAGGQAAVIAEIKKASPSKGVLRAEFILADIACRLCRRRMVRPAPPACRCWTDRRFFQGEPDFLAGPRLLGDLPVRARDFMVDAYQISPSRGPWGPTASELIAACWHDAQMAAGGHARSLDMAVLVEVHDRAGFDRALSGSARRWSASATATSAPPRCVTGHHTGHVGSDVPPDRLVVTESGIPSRADVKTMRDAGVRLSVGGPSVRAPDRASAGCAVWQLTGALQIQ